MCLVRAGIQKLTMNVTKTNYILIKNYQNPKSIDFPILLNSASLTEASSTRFWGVIIDQTMSWGGG